MIDSRVDVEISIELRVLMKFSNEIQSKPIRIHWILLMHSYA